MADQASHSNPPPSHFSSLLPFPPQSTPAGLSKAAKTGLILAAKRARISFPVATSLPAAAAAVEEALEDVVDG
ncbi:hypothetical protein BASA81_009856 [Batrachochytrium salamandrivorans]|nr:hypothetical protein BASA81_009856 [Batrachochytrium salamandrivorans]